jgi:hypothetical protein
LKGKTVRFPSIFDIKYSSFYQHNLKEKQLPPELKIIQPISKPYKVEKAPKNDISDTPTLEFVDKECEKVEKIMRSAIVGAFLTESERRTCDRIYDKGVEYMRQKMSQKAKSISEPSPHKISSSAMVPKSGSAKKTETTQSASAVKKSQPSAQAHTSKKLFPDDEWPGLKNVQNAKNSAKLNSSNQANNGKAVWGESADLANVMSPPSSQK